MEIEKRSPVVLRFANQKKSGNKRYFVHPMKRQSGRKLSSSSLDYLPLDYLPLDASRVVKFAMLMIHKSIRDVDILLEDFL